MTAARSLGGLPRQLVVGLALSLSLLGFQAAGELSPRWWPPASVDPGLTQTTDGQVPVIVQKWASPDRSPERSFARLGGTVTRDLPLVHGFAGTVPAETLDELATVQGIRALTLDRRVHVFGTPAPGPNSVYNDVVGTPAAWTAGYRGKGVTVAVIDTGVSEHADLGNGRLVRVTDEITGVTDRCINFSGEAGCQDSYGHGTFVAGIIAGDGSASGGLHKGVAPKARVLSVKLAGADGSADVSTLLAAIQWTVAHKDAYGIRVLNLSLGTDSPQSYLIDPLNYAVERAWLSGIVVVVAASNRGPAPATITKPADDPWVVTVGAIDDDGTADGSDDLIPNFTARGPTLSDSALKPDLVAPGARVVSLEAPGSTIATSHPSTIGGGYRRGSGTSFATPVVAGTVALMLERNPALTPDAVKYALKASARPTNSVNPFEVGNGLLDAAKAVLLTPPGLENQGLVQSSGMGSLHASRGTLLVTASDVQTLIAGEITQQLVAFDQATYLAVGWTGASWHGASWHGASWHGASWHGASWHGASWHGASWHGVEDENASYGEPGLGSAIYGAWG